MKRLGIVVLAIAGMALIVPGMARAVSNPPITVSLNILYFPGEISSGQPYNGYGQITYGTTAKNGIGSSCQYYVYLIGEAPSGYEFFDPSPFPFSTDWQQACYASSAGKCQYLALMEAIENGGCTGDYTEDVVIPIEADNYLTAGSPNNGNALWTAKDISGGNGEPIQSSKGAQCNGTITANSTSNTMDVYQGSWQGDFYLVGNQNQVGQCDH